MDINICFGLNDDYSCHCGCVIASILCNSNPEDDYNFFLISDYISEGNKQAFENLKNIRDFKLQFIKIDTKEFENLDVNNNIGISSFFRFKAFEMLNVDKYIYLDCDIIVRTDIADLYKTNIEQYYCAGVEDILNPILKEKYNIDPNSLYINAGVMLINLKKCKEDNIYNKILEFLNSPWDMKWGDQDIINKIFENKILGVDLKWNSMYPYNNCYQDKEYYNKIAQNPAIKHFITDTKPWTPGQNPHLKMEYFKYLRYTPWFDDFMFNYQINENTIIMQKLINVENILNAIINMAKK